MEENKQAILDKLVEALKLTRQHYDMEGMTYHPETEMVTVAWSEGGTSVNVALDSGIAMIRDILRAIE